MQVDSRIQKMKTAINIEAEQRARQIVEQAKEEADRERLKIFNSEKEVIDRQFEQLQKKILIRKKSSKINEQRIRSLKVKQDLIQSIRSEVHAAVLQRLSDQQFYSQYLQDLIVQGMIKLLQPRVVVRARAQHVGIIKKIKAASQVKFGQLFLKETGKQTKSQITVGEDSFLENQNQPCDLGGILITCRGERIICRNTVNARMQLAFNECLPQIRKGLFEDK